MGLIVLDLAKEYILIISNALVRRWSACRQDLSSMSRMPWKKDLVDNFQLGIETAPGQANVIRTTKVETLQTLVIYIITRGILPIDFYLYGRFDFT